jgi:hypothetical protein
MIAAGVFVGTPMPIHWLASKSGTMVLTVGMSGRSPDRAAPVTARARSFPERMKSMSNSTAKARPGKMNIGTPPIGSAAPDGYTLLLISAGNAINNPRST